MKYKLLRLSLMACLALLWGSAFAQDPDETITFSEMGYSNAEKITEVQGTDVTLTLDKGPSTDPAYYTTGTALRLYNRNIMTVASTTKTIEKVVFTFSGTNTFNALKNKATSFSTGKYEESETTGTWTGFTNEFTVTVGGTSGHVRIQKMEFYYSNVADTREATIVTLGEYQTTGEVGGSMNLPSATVTTASGTPLDVIPTWESSNTEVASIGNGIISFLAAGTTTITASYPGDNNTKPSSASYTLTVTAAPITGTITSLKALQEAVTETSMPVTIQFNDVFVTAVKGSNAYLADADGYGILVYQKNHGLEAGQVLNGTIEANLVLYKGQTEITGFSKDGLTITTTEVIPTEKTIDAITAANQSTLVTLKGVTFSNGKLSDGTNEITYYDNFSAGSLEEGATYDITGIVIVFNTTLEIAPRTADDIVKTSGEEPIDERQELTLSFPEESYEATIGEEFTAPVLSGVPEDFDGTIVYSSSNGDVATVGMEGEITLKGTGSTIITADAMFSNLYKGSASYTLTVKEAGETPVEVGDFIYTKVTSTDQLVDGAEYLIVYEDGKVAFNGALETLDAVSNTVDVTISEGKIAQADAVDAATFTLAKNQEGAWTVKAANGKYIGQSSYANGLKDSEDATTYTNAVSFDEEGNAVIGITFDGGTVTLRFNKASDQQRFRYYKSGQQPVQLYIKESSEQPVEPTFPITATWDFTNADIVAAAVALSGSTEAGTIESNGLQLAVEANGQTIRDNGNSIQTGTPVVFKVPVQGKKDVVTVVGYPGYFAYSIAGVDATEATTSYTATADDVAQGFVEIVSKGQYIISISVTQNEDEGGEEPAGYVYRDFEFDPLGDLLTADEQQQGAELSFGVVVNEDGTQTRVAADDEAANAVFSGTYHNDHGWRNFKAVVPVPGSVKITMSTCSWGSGVTVTDATGLPVAEFTTQKGEGGSGCYGGKKGEDPNIVSAEYWGDATTLTISGGGYVNYFAIEKIEGEEPVSQDITGTWTYSNEDVMTVTMALSGSTEAGEVEAAEKNGLMMVVEANGASFRNNGNNIQVRSGAVFKIPVRNAGDLITVKGYPNYSYYTIGNSTVELNNENTYTAKRSDAEAGYVAVTSTNDNNYYLSLSVVQYAPKEKVTLDNEPATVTFPFSEGTEGQKATFSNADYFLNSKVSHGDGIVLEGKDNKEFNQTWFNPVAKDSKANEGNAIRFLFTPKPGFTFTPTKVSVTSTRFGTDGGKLDFAWQNPDGTTVSLATGQTPNRDNGNDANKQPTGVPYSEYSYDIDGATVAEGTCGLCINLYSLDNGKHVGFSDILIEGTLSGTEKEVPILASFKINGNEYAVEDVFGEAYEATLELPKTEQMVGADNPLTDVTAASGDLGEPTYEEKEGACTVTIPMSAGETQMNYVLNVVFKPDFTLEYIGVDGEVLATQTVEKDAAIGEFAYDINEAPATKEGYKARGWFKTAVLGEKFTTADVITANTRLYAIQTEIEESSTHKKYFFDLADKFFYAEDHEAFNPAGDGFYWHDAQHGWAFKNGNTVDLLVGPKATITVTLCQYGSGTGIVVKKGEEVLETLPGVAEGDGGTAVYNYEGEAGTLTLEMQCGGEMYIHAMKIVNTAEVNFDSQGNWYFVKAGDAGSLIDVLDVVNGINASRDAERSFIFLPDGTYDLDATVKTAITGHNISLIGQSMDKTIIVTKPDISVEGLGKADMLDVSGTNLYMQDLTLKNALDYYNAGSAGRAAVLQDAGTRTIGKNVRMLSYQDTYYSSNSSQQAYWETCDIHGTVDFICGGGDIRFQNTTISLEPRKSNGTGGRTVVAPTTTTQFGYVFDGCTVVDLAKGQGDWNFGRTWQNEPVCVYLNTTLDDNAKNTLVASRWTQRGMNNKDPKLFGEYGTKDTAGNNITPASNVIASYGGNFETILTADQAAAFSYDRMFTNWDPATLARQLDAPAAKYKNGSVTWTPANDGAIAYALFRNGEFVALTEGSVFENIQIADGDVLTIRSANSCGGFGEPAEVEGVTTAISDVVVNASERGGQTIYNLNGLRVEKAQRGLYIINGKKVIVK